MEVIRRLEFKDIFKDEEILSPEKYLEGLNKKDAIRLGALCMSGLYNDFYFLCT